MSRFSREAFEQAFFEAPVRIKYAMTNNNVLYTLLRVLLALEGSSSASRYNVHFSLTFVVCAFYTIFLGFGPFGRGLGSQLGVGDKLLVVGRIVDTSSASAGVGTIGKGSVPVHGAFR